MANQIEKQLELKAPVSRVWRALTDHTEFGQWFGVKLDGPFVAGQPSHGRLTVPGYEHLKWTTVTQAIEADRLFSFTWHPYAIDPHKDYSNEPSTLVEFRLAPSPAGTLLTVTESGFDALPEERRFEAFHMNEGGWEAQMRNIAGHLDAHPG